jgi:hypothetical protein
MKSDLTPSEVRPTSRCDGPDRVRSRNGLPTINRRCSTKIGLHVALGNQPALDLSVHRHDAITHQASLYQRPSVHLVETLQTGEERNQSTRPDEILPQSKLCARSHAPPSQQTSRRRPGHQRRWAPERPADHR